jgi:autotransporter-associated beta strand protein
MKKSSGFRQGNLSFARVVTAAAFAACALGSALPTAGAADGTWASVAATARPSVTTISGDPNITVSANTFVVGDLVQASAAFGGFTSGRYFWVVASSGNTIQLSTTQGGSAQVPNASVTVATALRSAQRWNAVANWTGSVVASGIDAVATFPVGAPAAEVAAVIVDAPTTIGKLSYTNTSNSADFTLASGTNVLTFATTSGSPMIEVPAATNRRLNLGERDNAVLRFAGNQGLIIRSSAGGAVASGVGSTPAKYVVVFNADWSAFTGGLTIDRGVVEGGGVNKLPTQTLTLGTDFTTTNNLLAGLSVPNAQTIGGLNGNDRGRVFGGNTLTLGAGNANGIYAGFFGKDFPGAATNTGLVKTGTGRQTLGAIFGNGSVTVSAGTLAITGTATSTATGSVTIGNAATFLVNGTVAPAAASAKYTINSGGALGGAGTIQPFDTAGGNVMIDIKSGGTLNPGDATVAGGVGTLTLVQTNALSSVLNFSAGATATFDLGGVASDQVSIVGRTTVASEVLFSTTAINFNDLTSGGLSAGQRVLFAGDTDTGFGGLTTDGSGFITAGLAIGSGLGNYPGSTLQLVGKSVVLNLVVPAGTPPSAPSDVTVSGNFGGVTLTWTAPPAAATYTIKRATSPGGPFVAIATGVTGTSYTDTSANIGTTYYYVVTALNGNGESPASASTTTTVQGVGVSIDLRVASAGMITSDLAGAARLGRWNGLVGPAGGSSSATNNVLVDSNGAAIAGMSTTFAAGSGGGTFNMSSADTGNDATMIRSIFDIFNGAASTITISGIPYATYDLYLYMWDDGADRAGSFTVNGTTYYARGGAGNPTSSGTGYVRSSDTTLGAGNDIDQGNYIRVTGLSSASLNVSLSAVAAGNVALRNKFAGYQIVATTAPAPIATAPATPAGVGSVSGNNQATVRWRASGGATAYTIKRASSSGGAYTTLATIDATNGSYVDTTATNGATYFYVVTASNSFGESAASAETSASPYDSSLVRAISVNLRSINSFGMPWSDVAGYRRVDHWNNLTGPALQGQTVTLAAPKDNRGVTHSGMTASFTAGTTGTGYDLSGTLRFNAADAVQSGGETETLGGNESNLYTTAFDQYAGTPATLSVTGVPYASYDVVVYVRSELSTTRGGRITLGGATKYVRSGAGNPTVDGFGYAESAATTLSGATTPQGNFVRFSGLSGASFNASFVAENMGDAGAQRLKIAGFQIISNDPLTIVPPSAAPAAPTDVAAFPGNAQVSLTWTATPTATSYKVKRDGTVIATVNTPFADNTTAYADTSAANGTSYNYTIAAVNAVGTGADSAPVSATPTLPATFEAPLPAEWQYSIPVSPVQADYTTTVTADPERRAFLWVPPGVTQVRALVFSIQNMIELKMLESPSLRSALAADGIGIVWISSGAGPYMNLIQDPSNGPTPVPTAANNNGDKAAQAAVEIARVLSQFAAESGYSELAYCPIVSFQHSASSPLGWIREVYAKPALAGRVISIINKGYYPGNAPRGIPSLHLTSEWGENAANWGQCWDALDADDERKLRAQQGTTVASQPGGGSQALFGEFLQVGEGHYQADFMSDSTSQPLFIEFIRKTVAARVPAVWNGASYPTLTVLDQSTGGFVDVTQLGTGNASAVTLAQWQAAHPDDPEAKRAFWYIDLPYAQAIADFANDGFNKKPQYVTPVNPNGSLQNLYGVIGAAEYYPPAEADGITFKVKAAPIAQSQTFRLFHGAPVSIGSAPVKYIHSSGALRQVGPDTFQMWVDRGEIQHQSLPWDNFVIAYNRGDATHRAVDRPLHINIPILNTTGAAQTLTFPAVPNQIATNLQPILLNATASSGLPVQYWMISGPYLANGTSLPNSTLTPQPLPAKATFPLRVMVGAYQWGTRATPQFAASAPAYTTFWIFADAFQKWKFENFGTLSGGNGAVGAPNEQRSWAPLPASAADSADPDGDGYTNAQEFSLGTNPNVANTPLPPGSTAKFVHPGVIHTQTDFDRMKSKVLAGEEPWISGYNKLVADSRSSASYALQGPFATVTRSPIGSVNLGAWENDCGALHQNALLWTITGNQAHANKAIQLLNAWASTLTTINGSDARLTAGLQGHKFIAAAEIIRHTNAGWAAADIATCENFIRTVLVPLNRMSGGGNWGNIGAISLMSAGVFLEDELFFNEAVNVLRFGAPTECDAGISQYIHPDGWTMEADRDVGHWGLGLDNLAVGAHIAWAQGIDLWTAFGNRLHTGHEYLAKYTLGNTVPYTATVQCDGIPNAGLTTIGRGTVWAPFWEQVLHPYQNRIGLAAPFAEQAVAVVRPEGYDRDHVGFGSLVHALPTRTAGLAILPSGLAASATSGHVALTWDAASGATSYNVKRAIWRGGPYTTIASNVASPSYTDTNVANQTLYYYRVSGVNAAGETENSALAEAYPSNVAPAAPLNLVAKTITQTRIGLTWTPSLGATSYTIKRGASASGPHTTIASGVTSPFLTYADENLTAATTYHYVVAAVNALGAGVDSVSASASTLPTLPAGWTYSDAGYVTTPGQATYEDGTFTVKGAGLDYGGARVDSFGMAWMNFTGDGEFIARVAGRDNYSHLNKIGLALRESTAGGSKHALVYIDGENDAGFVSRTSTGGAGSGSGSTTVVGSTLPRWLKLKRAGNVFTGYVSADGATWTQLHSLTITMNNSLLAGLVVTSRNNGRLDTATFDNVSLPGFAVPAPAAPTDLTATAISGSEVSLSWTAAPTATNYVVKRASTSGGPYTTIASGITTTGFTDIGLTTSATYHYVVSAANITGPSANSAQASVTVSAPLPAITSATTISADAGFALLYKITATNSPTSFGASGLPAGLSINSVTGEIYGTPTAAGVSNVTLSATNSGGTITAPLELTVVTPPNFTWDTSVLPVQPTLTFTSGVANIAFSGTAPVIDDQVRVNTAVGNFANNSLYYVVAVSGSTLQLSSSRGGTAQIPSASGSSLGAVSQNWRNTGNWIGSAIADATGVAANFGAMPANARIVLGGDVTVGHIKYTGAGSSDLDFFGYDYVAANGGSLTWDTGSATTPSLSLARNMTFPGNYGNARNIAVAGTRGWEILTSSDATTGTTVSFRPQGGINWSGLTGDIRLRQGRIDTQAVNVLSSGHRLVLGNANTAAGRFAVLSVGAGRHQTIGALSGSPVGRVTAGSSSSASAGTAVTLTLGGTGLNGDFGGVIGADSVGASANTTTISLVKNGAGTQRLSGANVYTGTTTLNAGTLLIDGSLTSAVTANAGTLGGSGSSSAAITIGSGATFAPGSADPIGAFTTSVALTMNSGSFYACQIHTVTGSADKVVANGVTLNNAALSLTGLGSTALPAGTSFVIIDNTSASAVVGTFSNLAEGATITLGANTFTLTYQGGTGNDVVLTIPVPPPSAPTGLSAAGADGSVSLSWTASGGATSYTVKRSVSSGSGFAILASGLSDVSFTDTTVVNGTTYFYVVSATNFGGTSADSAEASARPSAPAQDHELLPPKVTFADGNAHVPVPASVIGHTYQIQYSTDLENWLDVGAPLPGTGADIEFVIPYDLNAPKKFYRVVTTL